MVEVNPVMLMAAGSVAAGVIAIVACMRGGNKKERKPAAPEHQQAPAPVASKPKKRSKPKSKGKKTAEEKEVPGSSSETDHAAPVVAQVAPVAPAAEEDEDDRADEDFFVNVELSKKPKKTKETQEQKASRLERQKQQKSAQKADEDVFFFSENSTTSGNRYNDHTSQSQGSSSSAYDGWAVVENPRKLKKKSESASDLEDIPPLMAPAPAAAALPAPSATPAVAEDLVPSPPIDSVTKELTVEARKLGLLIGPKGVTKIGLQTATGTEISMPKVEKDFVGSVTISVTGPAEGVDRAVHALGELCSKGYCNLLASPDFHEGYVEVKPK